MAFTPITNIHLLMGVPLNADYSDTIIFASDGAQAAYFQSKTARSYTDATYQRVNSTIRVPDVADAIYQCNYVMFRNPNFGQKWFYGFVREINYLNDKTTEVVFEIDAYQTWMFSLQVLPSFVEREHTLNDAPFANLQPEPYNVHPEVCTGETFKSSATAPAIVVCTSTDPEGRVVSGQMDGSGVYCGLQFHTFGANAAGAANSLISQYAEKGRLDSVVSVFMAPFNPTTPPSPETITCPLSHMADYTPRNKKLLSWPYCGLMADNSCGQTQMFQYEDWCRFSVDSTTGNITPSAEPPTFTVYRCGGASPGFFMTTQAKNLTQLPNENTMSITDFPVCGWSGNVFANWFAQNSTRMYYNIAKNAVASLFAMNPTASFSGWEDVIETSVRANNPGQAMGQVTPPIFAWAVNQLGFTIYPMSIRAEVASRIDTFFDMFGYATNMTKVPNMWGRASWNYVKTRDVAITGSAPAQDMQKIRAMFNNGVRFWHGDFVGNYSLSNEVINNEP